jgi:hypothetical protein
MVAIHCDPAREEGIFAEIDVRVVFVLLPLHASEENGRNPFRKATRNAALEGNPWMELVRQRPTPEKH